MKAFIFIFLMFFVYGNLLSQETITINAGSDSGQFKNYTGFIHGQTNLKNNPIGLNLVKELKPKYWRNANWNNTQFLADSLNINTTLVISDFYSTFKGGYANTKPWLDWNEYESFVDTLIRSYTYAGIAPTYWDIWNEPENTFYWSGSFAEFVECIIRTKQVANAISPAIKFVAPSLGYYPATFIESLLDSLASNGITLNAISWHEFGLPDSLDNHVSDFRNRMSLNPQWGEPEIHINEYSPSETNQIPAYRLGWLYHLEKTNVDWANTACWDNNFDGTTQWSGCGLGLNGLFWHDEQSPLPVYWVQRAYAEMTTGKILFCDNSDTKTLALSGIYDSVQEMRILVGRYYSIYNGMFLPSDTGKDSSNVSITINNYPYLTNGSISLKIQKIPKGDSIYQNTPLFSPITVFNGTTSVVNGTINLMLNNFKDGDVYYVYLNSNNILDVKEEVKTNDGINIYPNPAQNEFLVQNNNNTFINSILIKNLNGRMVLNENINNSESLYRIDILNQAPGIYFIQIITKKEIVTKKLVIE